MYVGTPSDFPSASKLSPARRFYSLSEVITSDPVYVRSFIGARVNSRHPFLLPEGFSVSNLSSGHFSTSSATPLLQDFTALLEKKFKKKSNSTALRIKHFNS